MSRYAGMWPICTYPGCACAREAPVVDDVPALMAEWIAEGGHAFCTHHDLDDLTPRLANLGVPATFTCDVEVES